MTTRRGATGGREPPAGTSGTRARGEGSIPAVAITAVVAGWRAGLVGAASATGAVVSAGATAAATAGGTRRRSQAVGGHSTLASSSASSTGNSTVHSAPSAW